MAKHLLYGDITSTAKQPYIKQTHQHYNEMIDEATKSICASITGNNNTNYYRMFGAENSSTLPAANISAGAVYYNGEIYQTDSFSSVNITNAIWGTITTTYATGVDPILFSDNSLHSVHQTKKIVWSNATSGDILFSNLQSFSSTSFVPTGVIMDWIAINPPSGYLVCDGSEVSKTTYANLYNLLGTTFGTAVSPANFKLPDLKRKVRVGRDASYWATIGYTAGEEFVQLAENETPVRTHNHTATFTGTALPDHAHTITFKNSSDTGNSSYGETAPTTGTNQQGGTDLTSAGTPSGTVTVANSTPSTTVQGHNNMQPFMILQAIIKH